jgi:hypothetical protein
MVEARRIPMCETNEQVADSLDSESTVRATPVEDAGLVGDRHARRRLGYG